MIVKINKYMVMMFEHNSTELSKSLVEIAASEEEAIEKTRHSDWWYKEGTGYDHKPLKYPLTFKAEIIKHMEPNNEFKILGHVDQELHKLISDTEKATEQLTGLNKDKGIEIGNLLMKAHEIIHNDIEYP